ncbi:MAG: DNA polymerase III subunit delta [Lentisphaerae bacterium RIFOXYA12_FULL_48_11]|nr:MAG: DNA polymerase III subunit delta [Lentisphaerae bacterium RIFOXYA12_FULL_48_11]
MAATVYLIFGDEYLVSVKAKALIESLVPAEKRTFGLEIIDGASENVESGVKIVDLCMEAIQTVGFMGDGKVIWFRDANFLHDNVVGKNADVKERLENLAGLIEKGLPEGQVLVVTAAKVDKRYAFYKACKGAGNVQEFAVADKAYMADKQAAQVAMDFFRNAGLKVNEQVLDMFLSKVGTDTRQILNEIEKLSVYMGIQKEVTINDIKEIVSAGREAIVWDLADAFGRRDLKLAIAVSRQLLFQKENVIGLIITLENRVKELMIYREGLDNGWLSAGHGPRGGAQWRSVPPEIEDVFSRNFEKDPRGGHPFRIGVLAEQARQFSPRQLQKCRKAVLDAHEKLVSRGIPDEMVLEPLLIQMLS